MIALSSVGKTLLVTEVIVCFLPASVLLVAGIPMSLMSLGMAADDTVAALMVLIPVAFGLAGMVGLARTLKWLLFRHEYATNGGVSLALMLLGVIPLLTFGFIGGVVPWLFLGALPLICSAHVAYLARDYLFRFLK